MKKFELTTDFITLMGIKLFKIKALISFGDVEAGDLGGFIEKEENLSQDGDACVCGDAKVCGDACINREADYATIKGFGREFRTTTFFRQKDKTIGVVCGCFYGTLEELRKKVKETHRDSKIAKEYLMIADLMETHFKE